eukprot:4655770-Prymnesium_polylepis.1
MTASDETFVLSAKLAGRPELNPKSVPRFSSSFQVSWDLTHDQSVRPTTGATTAAKRPPITP